jgi:hypothetical protein
MILGPSGPGSRQVIPKRRRPVMPDGKAKKCCEMRFNACHAYCGTLWSFNIPESIRPAKLQRNLASQSRQPNQDCCAREKLFDTASPLHARQSLSQPGVLHLQRAIRKPPVPLARLSERMMSVPCRRNANRWGHSLCRFGNNLSSPLVSAGSGPHLCLL